MFNIQLRPPSRRRETFRTTGVAIGLCTALGFWAFGLVSFWHLIGAMAFATVIALILDAIFE